MITRRHFLKATGLSAMLWAGRGIPAVADDGSRVALVVGNNAYAQAPLDNPVNDARAFGGLLRTANFQVDLRTDVVRAGLLDAIDGFATAIARRETQLGLFYFAGHGAQLAWRNYLLPVDAAVTSADELLGGCVDLGLLLQRMGQVQGKTFVVILDACRDNPFGAAYQPERRGLSQFDAPVGSLLAYATAPGRVASDGIGQHGLYTGHLLKEFAAPETSIEDALKRVRLNVRLDSNGTQIPWESTSLEENVFLFPAREALSDEEIERQFAVEVAAWNTVKQSRVIDDWVAYLRRFPNGRFSEIAQLRLNRLLAAREQLELAKAAQERAAREQAAREKAEQAKAEQAKAEQAKAEQAKVEQAKVEQARAEQARAERDRAKRAAAQDVNPYSAGTFAAARDYKVGDEIHYRQTDLLTGSFERDIHLRVTLVDEANDRVEFNQGFWVSDLNGNIEKMAKVRFDLPVQIVPAELQVGKHWVARFTLSRGQGESTFDLDLRIRVRERVLVPAGAFNAFRIDGLGWGDRGQRMDATYWVVPGINPFYVRRDLVVHSARGSKIRQSQRHELLAYRQ